MVWSIFFPPAFVNSQITANGLWFQSALLRSHCYFNFFRIEDLENSKWFRFEIMMKTPDNILGKAWNNEHNTSHYWPLVECMWSNASWALLTCGSGISIHCCPRPSQYQTSSLSNGMGQTSAFPRRSDLDLVHYAHRQYQLKNKQALWPPEVVQLLMA